MSKNVARSTVLLLALVAGPAALAANPKAPAAPAPAAPAGNAVKELTSGDASRVRAALDDARMGGKASASLAPVIADLLIKGLTPSLTEAAIDTLGDLESEAGSPALAIYAKHRTTKVRQAAIRALIKTKGPAAVQALRHGLSDIDPMVRGLSANGLGSLKAKDALGDLALALDHGVNEAAGSIGQLCGPAECEALSNRLGKLPFDVVTGGLDAALFRADMPEDGKIKIVGKVRELGTSEANKYLRDAQKRGGSLSPRVKQAIDQAVSATPGGL